MHHVMKRRDFMRGAALGALGVSGANSDQDAAAGL